MKGPPPSLPSFLPSFLCLFLYDGNGAFQGRQKSIVQDMEKKKIAGASRDVI
jgi:hypothetical protein